MVWYELFVNSWRCTHTESVILSLMWQFNNIKLPLTKQDWSRWVENNEQGQREENQTNLIFSSFIKSCC